MNQLYIGNVFDIKSKDGKVNGTYILWRINEGIGSIEHENEIPYKTREYVFWKSPFSKGPGQLRLGEGELDTEYDIEVNHLTVQPPLGGKKKSKKRRTKKQRKSRRRS